MLRTRGVHKLLEQLRKMHNDMASTMGARSYSNYLRIQFTHSTGWSAFSKGNYSISINILRSVSSLSLIYPTLSA